MSFSMDFIIESSIRERENVWKTADVFDGNLNYYDWICYEKVENGLAVCTMKIVENLIWSNRNLGQTLSFILKFRVSSSENFLQREKI